MDAFLHARDCKMFNSVRNIKTQKQIKNCVVLYFKNRFSKKKEEIIINEANLETFNTFFSWLPKNLDRPSDPLALLKTTGIYNELSMLCVVFSLSFHLLGPIHQIWRSFCEMLILGVKVLEFLLVMGPSLWLFLLCRKFLNHTTWFNFLLGLSCFREISKVLCKTVLRMTLKMFWCPSKVDRWNKLNDSDQHANELNGLLACHYIDTD